MNLQNLEKTTLFSCQSDVQQLSSDLFRNLDFSYFSYNRFFSDNSFVGVTSNFDFTGTLQQQSLGVTYAYIQSLIKQSILLRHENYYFSLPAENYYNKKLAKSHGIADIVAIIEPIKNGVNLFTFGSHKENGATETILHRPDVLLKHKHNFMSSYKNKLPSIMKHRLLRLGRDAITAKRESTMIDYDTFKNSMNPSHYFIIKDGNRIAITAREKETLQHLARAKTIKEIALVMSIAPSTVNTYLLNLQQKLGVATKRALVRLYFNSDLCIIDAEYFTAQGNKQYNNGE